MADIFTILGVVVVVGAALTGISLACGYMTDRHDWVLPSFIWCVLMSTAMVSCCIIIHILKLGP